MEGSFFDLVDELGLRLKLNDAYLARDDAEARRLERQIRDRFGDRSPETQQPSAALQPRASAA